MGTLVMLWLFSQGGSPAPAPVSNPWPCSIHLAKNGPSLLPSVWDLSATFQHQCRRLAAARVVVVVQWADDLTTAHHAETRLVFDGGRLFRAVVRLRAGDEPAVQLVHEMEHLMEALDGIDQRSSKWGSRTQAGAYETARAKRAESWARRELAPLLTQAAMR